MTGSPPGSRPPRPPGVDEFLAHGAFAVVGASPDRDKYGNKVVRCYQQRQLPVVGVNPKQQEVEGVPCYPTLRDVPGPARAVSIVAPPAAAAKIVADAMASRVQHLWFQPGAEEETAVAIARKAGINVIAGGPCVLVVLHYRE